MAKSSQRELVVPYDKSQKALYKAGDSRCIYDGAYPRTLWHGIYRHGRFPDVVVRTAFLDLGYTVLMSDPGMPNQGGYVLTHYAGKREQGDEAFSG